jgi:hypothetical protein
MLLNDPQGCAGPPLELVADHAGPTADIAFCDRPIAYRRVESGKSMLRFKRKAADVAQPSVIGLGNDW